MSTIHSTVEPRKHVHVTAIGDEDVALDIGRPGRPAVSLVAIRIPAAELRAALDKVAPTSPDYADGGVTAALVEAEVAGSYTRTDEDGLTLLMVQQQRDQATARAEKTEQERDGALRHRDRWRKRAEAAEEAMRTLCAEQSRGFTAEDITDDEWAQIKDRAWGYWENHSILNSHGLMRMMQHAFAKPARHPEAEAWEEELGEMPAAADLTPEQRARLADALAERDHALGVTAPEVEPGKFPAPLAYLNDDPREDPTR